VNQTNEQVDITRLLTGLREPGVQIWGEKVRTDLVVGRDSGGVHTDDRE